MFLKIKLIKFYVWHGAIIIARPRVKSGLTRAPWQPNEKSVNRGLTKNLEKMPRSTKIKPLGSQAFF